MTTLTLIWAEDRNRSIGRLNTLPWLIPEDLAYFKRTTLGSPVIMGRKTFESLPKALPGRKNIVLSRDGLYQPPGAQRVASASEAMELACSTGAGEVFGIGGGQVYEQLLSLASRVLVTEVDTAIDSADAWAPAMDPKQWACRWIEDYKTSSGPEALGFRFVEYLRRPS